MIIRAVYISPPQRVRELLLSLLQLVHVLLDQIPFKQDNFAAFFRKVVKHILLQPSEINSQ